MITPLIAAALIATSGQTPDHLVSEVPVVEEINFKKPLKGGFSDVIRAAAKVPKRWEPFASCVLQRESGADLKNKNSGEGARNPRSSASGRWQFLNTSWNRSLAFMVADQLRDHGMPKKEAKQVRVHLQSMPIYKWDGHWQDAGAIEVLQQGGWNHWANGDKCDRNRSR